LNFIHIYSFVSPCLGGLPHPFDFPSCRAENFKSLGMDSKLLLEAARGTLDGSLSFPTGKGARASRLRFSASRQKHLFG
jgi:hypothetical protein